MDIIESILRYRFIPTSELVRGSVSSCRRQRGRDAPASSASLGEGLDQSLGLPRHPNAHALFTLRFTNRRNGTQLAHFFYEADRGTMISTDMLKKFRAYHHFIKRQKKHREALGVHPIRAVLIETTDETRGKRLMDLANHPLVCGPGNRAGLFWFTISPLFADTVPSTSGPSSQPLALHLERPAVALDPIWALPDHSLHALSDAENSPTEPQS